MSVLAGHGYWPGRRVWRVVVDVADAVSALWYQKEVDTRRDAAVAAAVSGAGVAAVLPPLDSDQFSSSEDGSELFSPVSFDTRSDEDAEVFGFQPYPT